MRDFLFNLNTLHIRDHGPNESTKRHRSLKKSSSLTGKIHALSVLGGKSDDDRLGFDDLSSHVI
jgi:hypothetical protein